MEIIHQEGQSRFYVEMDGYIGYVEYEIRDKRMDILHTVVPKEIGGRGIAGALVAAAVDHARQLGLDVEASCSYAARWLERHQG